MTSAIITTSKLCIGWGQVTLIKDLDLVINRGECFFILGGSGCGKSTLLRHLVGLEQPKSGSIDIDGIGAPTISASAPPFGMMFQSGALFGSMTLRENCLLPLQAWTDVDKDTAEHLVKAKLDLVGLGFAANHLPGEMSGGMKKRAGIARAMMLEPELLFLDEPSAGLDPISAVEFDDLVKTLCTKLGITAVIVSHELPSIFRIADRCLVLEKESQGKVAEGDPAYLRDHSEHPFVHHFFNRSSPEASPPMEPTGTIPNWEHSCFSAARSPLAPRCSISPSIVIARRSIT
ncbi:MAG: ATP-binding cassette domain-containing protein [Planctomycetota bacterium]|nr:ATP-binding cassette domain-containing protein [Planctomycetota bacterium]